jgi:hypothetical protein
MTTYAEHESAALKAEQRHDWLDAASHWRRAAAVAVGLRTRERAEKFAEEALAHAQAQHGSAVGLS